MDNLRSISDSKNPTLSHTIILIAIGGLIYGISIGLNLTSLPLMLSALNFSKTAIAHILSFEIIAIFFVAPFLQRIISYLGFFNSILLSLVIRNVFLILLGFSQAKFLLITNIFLFGAGGYVLFACLQLWVSQSTSESNRGASFGLLNASFALGIAIGPIILKLTQISPGTDSIMMSGLVATCMIIPLALLKQHIPIIQPVNNIDFYSILQKARIPIMCAFIADYAFFAFGDFIVLYGVSQGLSQSEAILLVTYMVMSSIFLDLPIGWITDRLSRKLMVIVFTCSAIISFQLIPYVILNKLQTIALFAFLSSSISGIYICGISLLGDSFKGQDLIAANSMLSIMNAAGAICGILITGFAIDTWGDHGLIISLTSMFSVFLLFNIVTQLRN